MQVPTKEPKITTYIGNSCMLLPGSGKKYESSRIRWNSGLTGKRTACVRVCNLFAILVRNAGSLARESSVLSSSRLDGNNTFLRVINRSCVLLAIQAPTILLFCCFFLCSRKHTHLLLCFIHINFSISSLCSWDPQILFFKVEVAITSVWTRKVSLKRKAKLLQKKVKCAIKKKIRYLHALLC